MSALGWGGVFVLWLGLAGLEWRRTDRARRGRRLVAVTLAVGALAVMVGRSGERSAAGGAEAVLWTAQAAGAAEGAATARQFALPDAKGAPADATVVPDVAYLRRTFPEITTLEIRGDGVAPDEAAELAGLRVRFRPAGTARGFVAVDAPTTVTPGESVRVRGRVAGLAAGGSAVVTLAAPDGAVQTATVGAGAEGFADFNLVAPPAPAAGRFEWRLSYAAAAAPERILEQEILGVAAVAPELPRVLLLESAPRLDTARLRAWFAAMGGRMTSRTQVSRERYRFAASAGAAGEWAALDEKILADYDVVLTDGATLAALGAAERMSLREAVTTRGVGVGLLADDAVLAAGRGGAGATTDDFFGPWNLAASGADALAEAGRRVRLRGPEGSVLPAEPVAVSAAEIKVGAEQTVWLRDGQARTVAAAVRRGRGRVALSLVTDTWRWRQGERPAAFAEYWSWWLRELAPAAADAGRWAVESAWPRVDRAVRLRWTGPAEGGRTPAAVRAEGERVESRVALAQDRAEPARWTGEFWPRRAGWHRVTGASGAEFDFWVNAAEAWPGLWTQAKRDATARVAAASEAVAGTGGAAMDTRARAGGVFGEKGAAVVAFVVFVASAGYLWWEGRRRRSGGAYELSGR